MALEGRTIVFVEVRSTAGTSSDRPAESVDLRKQERLTNLALHFLSSHRLLGQSARFDVVIVHWPAGQREPTLTHHRQAFEAVGRHQMFN